MIIDLRDRNPPSGLWRVSSPKSIPLFWDVLGSCASEMSFLGTSVPGHLDTLFVPRSSALIGEPVSSVRDFALAAAGTIHFSKSFSHCSMSIVPSALIGIPFRYSLEGGMGLSNGLHPFRPDPGFQLFHSSASFIISSSVGIFIGVVPHAGLGEVEHVLVDFSYRCK